MLPAASFWDSHSDLISAVITMAVAIAIAFAVDRLVIARAGPWRPRWARDRSRGPPQTRLRLVRRLVFVVILVIGAALALSQLHQVRAARHRDPRLERGARAW